MHRADAIILGGGLIGLTLAIALDRHGLSTIVVDPADPADVDTAGFDGRATAIASASWRMLDVIGISAALEPQACPIRTIRVSDGLDPGGLVFQPPADDAPLGMMVENRLLRATLRKAAQAAPNVTLLAPAQPGEVVRDGASARVALTDGRLAEAPLLIGAEGRSSPTRDAAQIRMARWSYDHAAIVVTVTHERPHDNVAYEIFYPEGPFAILPMLPGTRSAIVWSVAQADAPALLDLPDRAFIAELEKRMGGFLGRMELAGPRSSYRLGFHHAAKITGTRLCLRSRSSSSIPSMRGILMSRMARSTGLEVSPRRASAPSV